MSAPLLSVVIPTRGRPGLARTLTALRAQAPATDLEILVVGDTHNATYAEALAPVPALAAAHDARYLACDGGLHAVGQPQRNWGAQAATGQWLAWGQDDNVHDPGAWDAWRTSIARGPVCPRLFRVETTHGGTVWHTPDVLAHGNCDADGLLFPNDPPRLAHFPPVYAGDWHALHATVALYGGQLLFEPFILATKQGG